MKNSEKAISFSFPFSMNYLVIILCHNKSGPTVQYGMICTKLIFVDPSTNTVENMRLPKLSPVEAEGL